MWSAVPAVISSGPRAVLPVSTLAGEFGVKFAVATSKSGLPGEGMDHLSEPGCLGYQVLRSLEDPAGLVLIESYRDEAALDAHLSSPHYQDLVVGRIRPLLTDRRVEFLRPRDAT